MLRTPEHVLLLELSLWSILCLVLLSELLLVQSHSSAPVLNLFAKWQECGCKGLTEGLVLATASSQICGSAPTYKVG
jgi:hypothetical protein